MLCDYDSPHSRWFCNACWTEYEEAKGRETQEQILRELKRTNDLKEWEFEQRGFMRPERTYNVPKQVPVTEPLPEIRRQGL